MQGFVSAGSRVKNTGSKFYQWTEITDITSSAVCQPAKTWQGKENTETAPGRALGAEIWAQEKESFVDALGWFGGV